MFKTKVHAGKMVDCLVCTPIQDRRKKKFEKKVKKEKGDLYSYLRRQINEEAGEEPTSSELFGLTQKYGVNDLKEQVEDEVNRRNRQLISESRRTTKPSWKEEKEWKTEQQEWFKTTRPLVVSNEQFKKPVQNKFLPRAHFQPIQFPQPGWKKSLPTSAPRDSER